MLLIVVLSLLVTACYAILMVAYMVGWAREKVFTVPLQYEPRTYISVIVPARNEAANIGACIESVLAQKYPKELFEIIVIDDHSEDNTAALVAEYEDSNVRCFSLAAHMPPGEETNSFKKVAIGVGVLQSKGTLIVTTDADCTTPNTWLRHIAAIYEQEKPVMIVAPVIYKVKKNIVQLFQLIDFMGMQGITAAAHALKLGNMSNGANLAFSKAAFEQVGGYDGILHLASGDDYLLMMKMSKFSSGGISYLKSANAVVATLPQPNWKAFLQQRIRWASKSGKYNDVRLTLILLLVYVFNLLLVVLAVGSLFNYEWLFITYSVFVVKLITEYFFLRRVAQFFGKEWALWYFPFLQPLHIIYIVVAGFLGFVGGYEWKGRRVK